MTRHGCNWKRQTVMPGGAYHNQTIDRAMMEKLGILIDKIGPEAVAGNEVKISFLQEVIFDSAQDRDVITLADLGYQHTDGETASGTKTACKEIGTIVELPRCRENQFLGFR